MHHRKKKYLIHGHFNAVKAQECPHLAVVQWDIGHWRDREKGGAELQLQDGECPYPFPCPCPFPSPFSSCAENQIKKVIIHFHCHVHATWTEQEPEHKMNMNMNMYRASLKQRALRRIFLLFWIFARSRATVPLKVLTLQQLNYKNIRKIAVLSLHGPISGT